jgi:hypothetical protein
VCAFSHQVYAPPLSLTTLPNQGLASTFTQGAGVRASRVVVITYSRPSWVKPPRPLNATRSDRTALRAGFATARGTGGERSAGANSHAGISTCRRRFTCSLSGPSVSLRIKRATVWIRTLSSSESWSPRRKKMPPGRSSSPAPIGPRTPRIASERSCR